MYLYFYRGYLRSFVFLMHIIPLNKYRYVSSNCDFIHIQFGYDGR